MDYFGVANYCFKFRHFVGDIQGVDDQIDLISAHLNDDISHRVESSGEPVEVAERNALAQLLPPQKLASEYLKTAYKGEQTRYVAALVFLAGVVLIAETQSFSNVHFSWVIAQMLLVARAAVMFIGIVSSIGLWALALPFSNRSVRFVRVAASALCPLLGISTILGMPLSVLTIVIMAQVGRFSVVQVAAGGSFVVLLGIFAIGVMIALRRAQRLLGRYVHADQWVDDWPAWLKKIQ